MHQTVVIVMFVYDAQDQLNKLYDTPRKSTTTPKPSEFSSQPEYTARDLNKILDTATDVVNNADEYSNTNIHEATLTDFMISPLLHLPRLLERFASKIKALNM